ASGSPLCPSCSSSLEVPPFASVAVTATSAPRMLLPPPPLLSMTPPRRSHSGPNSARTRL
ncbi:hypothetical protein C0991_004379, partial [Blastosporella zonata]